MRYKSNRAFTLLEVLITVAILSTAIVFVFRAFTTVLASVKFSQNITLACFLAEDKLWDIEQEQKEKTDALGIASDTEKIQDCDFNWDYTATEIQDLNLVDLKFNVKWKENVRENEYVLNIVTYLIPKE